MEGAREVVQHSNDIFFLVLDIDVALAGSPIRCWILRDAPNIATNKTYKTPCKQTPKISL